MGSAMNIIGIQEVMQSILYFLFKRHWRWYSCQPFIQEHSPTVPLITMSDDQNTANSFLHDDLADNTQPFIAHNQPTEHDTQSSTEQEGIGIQSPEHPPPEKVNYTTPSTHGPVSATEKTNVKTQIVTGHEKVIDNIIQKRQDFKKQWSNHLDADEVAEILKLCNECRKKGEKPKIPLCVRCGDISQLKNSHIIPNSILKEIQNGQCRGEPNFMRDITGSVQKAEEYTYPLLCKKCERPHAHKKHKGDFEDALKRVYLILLQDATLFISRDPKIESDWFPRILAEIMLRGVFVSKDLDMLLNQYRKKIVDLWKYAAEIGTGDVCGIKLFILPNWPAIMEDTPLDLTLCAPQQTELCKFDCGHFLYTHFDCLHWVLPLDDGSTKYFQYFQGSRFDKLTRSTYPEIVEQGGDFRFSYPKDVTRMFPEALLIVNIDRYYRSVPEEKRNTKSPMQLVFGEEGKLEEAHGYRLIIETCKKRASKETDRRTDEELKQQINVSGISKGSNTGVYCEKITKSGVLSYEELEQNAYYRLAKYFRGKPDKKSQKIIALKEQLGQLKKENSALSKTIDAFEKCCKAVDNFQAEKKKYQERIGELERERHQNDEQRRQLQEEGDQKDREIDQLKKEIQQLENEKQNNLWQLFINIAEFLFNYRLSAACILFFTFICTMFDMLLLS